MRFRIRFANQLVGVFILIALAAVVIILISMGANQRWFARNYHYHSSFGSANGLSIGMPITFKGFQIGKVTSIALNDQNRVDVDFYIQDTYIDKVYENSILQLTSSPIGIGGGLLFHQGSQKTEPIPENSYIPSYNTAQAQRLVAEGKVTIPTQDDTVAKLLSQVGPVLENVNKVLVSFDTVMADASAALQGNGTGPMQDIVTKSNEMLGHLNLVLTQAETISDNLAAITTEFRDPTGMIPKLLDAKGSVATFLDDNNALYNQIEALLTQANKSMQDVQKLTSFAGDSTPELAAILEEGRQALNDGQDVLEGLKNNPLLRGGIANPIDQPTTFSGTRDGEF